MLDIGIGLVIVYIAGAVLVSGIQELIASLLQWRSQHLKESILQMMLNKPSQLQPEPQVNSEEINLEKPSQLAVTQVLEQTNIDDNSSAEVVSGEESDQCSQLKVAEMLQRNIYDSSLVQSMNHTSVNFWSQFSSKYKKGAEKVWENKYKNLFANTDPSYLSSEIFATALLQQLKEELKELLENPDKARTSNAIKEIKEKIQASDKLPTSLQEILLTLANRVSLKADEADNKLLMFQKEIEGWFDDSMSRASGVYKRNTQLLCFILGFAIAIIFNLDSLFLAQRLSQDTAMRTALAGGAETIVKESTKQNSQNFDPDKLQENINSLLGNSSFIAPITENAGNLVDCAKNQLTCPLKPGIPNFGKVASAVLGWIITALAIYMGAPFWFEILGKLVNVRSTGKKS